MFPALTFHLFNLKKYLQYCFLNPRGGAVGSPIMMAFDAFALEYLAPQSVPKTFFPIQIVLFLPEWVPTIARSLFYKLYKITLSKIKKPKNSLFLVFYGEPSPLGGSTGPGWKAKLFLKLIRNFFQNKTT